MAAARRGDARVLLVSLGFLAAAGFLGLHALATPGGCWPAPTRDSWWPPPVGLALGSVFAAMSGLELSGDRGVAIMRYARLARLCLVLVMAVWAVASLMQLPPLDQESAPEQAGGVLVVVAVLAIALYAVAAFRYLMLWRRRPP